MNNWSGIGRFTTDPELKTTQSGKAVTSFCIAVPRSYDKEQVYYIDCVAWEKRAETICKYFRKGKMIAITGEIQTRKYEDKQGKSRKATEIRVNEFTFCGDKSDTKAEPKTEFKAVEVEDELPF